ncbi:hypothetical protein [Desulfosarcina variabilis]|uniref:hypothetical protein n=1 Tax=Desulfosarcina variabilis TaxID=2300 RepID=UPI003AFB6613
MSPMAKPDNGMPHLLCHNQFVLGPEPLTRYGGWQHVPVTSTCHLSAHPNLHVTQIEAGGIALTAVGYMIDPLNPQASDEAVLQRVHERMAAGQGYVDATGDLGGRWVLIARTASTMELITDAVGHRQVFYTAVTEGLPLWCASQPRILAELTDQQMDADAASFIDSYEFRKNLEYRWPGAGSPYKGVFHLLPNHRLDLNSGKCQRYWPDRPLPQVSVEAAVPKVAAYLKGGVEAVARRFDLAVSLTAGLDSRTVLAAARNVVGKNPVMTVRQIDKPDDHADVQVASQLASLLGLGHDIIKSSLIIDDAFLQSFKQHTALPHYIYVPDAQAIYNRYQRKRVAVTGSISEIGRLSFRMLLRKPETEPIDAYDLARLQKMGRQAYAVKAFGEWQSGLGNIHNVPLLDMFEWEQGHGNWLAMCHTEFDMAWKDLYSPFNCRNLLTLLLSVDSRHRQGTDCRLYNELINTLWPDVLQVPINPHYQSKPRLTAVVISKIPYPIKKSIKQLLRRR